MTKKEVLNYLEEFLHASQFRLIYDDIEGEGGFCELKGKPYIIINRRLPIETRIKIIASELGRLNSKTLPEKIRQIIEKWGDLPRTPPQGADTKCGVGTTPQANGG